MFKGREETKTEPCYVITGYLKSTLGQSSSGSTPKKLDSGFPHTGYLVECLSRARPALPSPHLSAAALSTHFSKWDNY